MKKIIFINIICIILLTLISHPKDMIEMYICHTASLIITLSVLMSPLIYLRAKIN